MLDWGLRNPREAVGILAVLVGMLAAIIRFGLVRHREFVRFSEHMRREEEDVWPVIQQQISMNHAETLELFREHGERLARVEAKMPNGDITEIKRMVESLLRRKE